MDLQEGHRPSQILTVHPNYFLLTGGVERFLYGTARKMAISLSTSNTAAATVPSTVTIAIGTETILFTVTTCAVSSSQTGTISATFNGVTLKTILTVNP